MLDLLKIQKIRKPQLDLFIKEMSLKNNKMIAFLSRFFVQN